jgi:hypothetical protein
VEPVFGSLLNFYGMRRCNARGKTAAHQVMLLAATAYNLQKLLAFAGGPKVKVKAFTKVQRECLYFFALLQLRLLVAFLDVCTVVQQPLSFDETLLTRLDWQQVVPLFFFEPL